MSTPLVLFKNVQLGYKRNVILDQLSFAILKGDFIGIAGANGSGKTTLLNAMLGLIKPMGGEIERITPDTRKPLFAYVPQRGLLDEGYPFRVIDIISMGRYGQMGMRRKLSSNDRRLSREAMEHLDIAGLADKRYAELSGGQKQRVLLARAICSEPALLVLDEPTDGLDLASQQAILQLVRHFHGEHQMTVVLVSHQLNDTITYADKIGLLHEGRLLMGTRKELISSERLSQIFNIPILVEETAGKPFILTGTSA